MSSNPAALAYWNPGHALERPPPCTTDPVAEGKTLVAFVGDSITFGYNCKKWQSGFVKVVQDRLGTDKYDVRDCGVRHKSAVDLLEYL